MLENDEELQKQSEQFFQYISNKNLPEIVKFFRNESIKPWEFLLDGDFNGNYFIFSYKN